MTELSGLMRFVGCETCLSQCEVNQVAVEFVYGMYGEMCICVLKKEKKEGGWGVLSRAGG